MSLQADTEGALALRPESGVLESLMAGGDLCRPLRECGRNWLAIYLAFALPMAAALTYLPDRSNRPCPP